MFAPRLAAMAALSLVSVAPAAAQPASVTIYLWSFNYAPKPIYLRAGRPVTLTFVNRSGSSHDFVARSFFANSRILSGMGMGSAMGQGMGMGKAMDGMVDLRGGETKRVTLVPRAGTYPVHCSHFMHKQLGMSDVIVVN